MTCWEVYGIKRRVTAVMNGQLIVMVSLTVYGGIKVLYC